MRDIVLCLCDLSGKFAQPWIRHGHKAILVDPQHTTSGWDPDGNTFRVADLIDSPAYVDAIRQFAHRICFVAAFPPCTNLAVSGSRWFAAKAAVNPNFQLDAVALVKRCADIIDELGQPGFIENPIGVIPRLWRRWDFMFHPFEFTDWHLDDNYTKATCLWARNGFVMPEPKIHHRVTEAIEQINLAAGKNRIIPKDKALELFPLDDLIRMYYPDNRIHACGPSEERSNIRSSTPLGFSEAVFDVNWL